MQRNAIKQIFYNGILLLTTTIAPATSHALVRAIDYPTVESRSTDYLQVTRVELTDSATIFSITLTNGDDNVRLDSGSYLTDRRRIYRLIRHEGFPLETTIPPYSARLMRLFFEPVDRETAKVTFIGHAEGQEHIRIPGIELNKNRTPQPRSTIKTIRYPELSGKNTEVITIDSIEMRPDITVFHMQADFCKRGWIRIVTGTYLQDNTRTQRYKLLKAERFPLNERYIQSQNFYSFKLYFEPLPEEIRTVDFIEGYEPRAFRFWGIRLDDSTRLKNRPIRYSRTEESVYPLYMDHGQLYTVHRFSVSPKKTELLLMTNEQQPDTASIGRSAILYDKLSCRRYRLLKIENNEENPAFIPIGRRSRTIRLEFEPLTEGTQELTLSCGEYVDQFYITDLQVPPPEPVRYSLKEVLLIVFGSVLLLGGVAWIFFRMYLRNVRKREENKRMITELQLKAIRSQMNPHFIFNALASIQHLINRQKEQQANEYLVQFSRLLRKVLASSELPLVALSDEIELLTLYLKLEQLRIPFRFRFIIDKNVNRNEEIPGMLLQPIVENAVVHGLKGKADGHIEVRIRREADTLVCEVIDDGIGIGEPKPDNGKPKPKPEGGFGLRSSTQRLVLLNRNLDTKIGIRQESWKNGGKSGTRITIVIPV